MDCLLLGDKQFFAPAKTAYTPSMAIKKRSADLESGSADQLAFYVKKHKASGDNDCLMGKAIMDLGKIT